MESAAARSIVVGLLVTGLIGAHQARAAPRVHHMMIEVSNLDASITFYRDRLGLKLGGRSRDFATLEADNVGVYLWQSRWEWEGPKRPGERGGVGLYPHLEVADVKVKIAELRGAGCKIVQEPKSYDWGTEAFVADPDGYVWALVRMKP